MNNVAPEFGTRVFNNLNYRTEDSAAAGLMRSNSKRKHFAFTGSSIEP